MTLSGDLATLDLGDLLQNLEAHGKTGVLSVEGTQGTSHLYFQEGKLALFGAEGRANLMDVLVACGRVRAEALDKVRRKRRGSKKSLGEMLVAGKLVAAEELAAIARDRMLDEACELVASGTGAFTFREGGVPRGMFDAEERRLGLALPAGPLLMESARREDHWHLIRDRIPSDSAHYIAQRRAREDDGELGAELTSRLDGSVSVTEVMTRFPHRRFEAYQALANLAEGRAVKLAGPEDMLRLARELVETDPDRAWRVLNRAMETSPQHLELLCERADLAENLGELETAVESLKLLVHLNLEAGRHERAHADIERAKRISPNDPVLWERSLILAMESKRTDDAIQDGVRLAELYREPGLHKKAAEVYSQLTLLDPEAWQLARELASSLAAFGAREQAVEGLERFLAGRIAAEDYALAREVASEILEVDPSHTGAPATIQRIDEGVYARRKARRKRVLQSLVGLALVALFTRAAFYEAGARMAYSDTTRAVSRQNLIEWGRYDEAATLFEDVRTAYPWSLTARFDVERRLADLGEKSASSPAALKPFVLEASGADPSPRSE